MKTDNLKKIIKKQKGFTLVEIIAVLVVLGVLAAVAAPKFVGLQAEARAKAVWGGIAECKSTLSVAYGKAYLSKGSQPTITEVLAASGLTNGASTTETFGDIQVNIVGGADLVTITSVGIITDHDSTPIEVESVTSEEDKWRLPSNT